ncbi:MAG: 4'-phosphopantetheinyl transferase family protein [Opitutaceae bacterium]
MAISQATLVNAATHHFAIPGLDNARAVVALARAQPPDLAARAREDWLRGEELDRFERFKVEHARGDFLAGRMAAKSALCALAPDTEARSWEIVRGLWRQPCVRGPAGGLKVTLAHSAGIAVAVAFDDRWTCGIDLERADRDAAEVVESQVTPEEAAWARASDGDITERWMLLWTAREATGKSFGTGLLFPELLPRTHDWNQRDGVWHAQLADGGLLAIRALAVRGFALSWLLPLAAAESPVVLKALQWLREEMPAQ